MKVVGCREIVPQSSSDDSDSDDELFDYLNMSQKTDKQAQKDLNKDDSTEKKGKISNINTINIDLNKDSTKASIKINELSSIFTKVGTTESPTTHEEGSAKTEHSHQHEPQTFFQQDVTCHDEKGNPLLSAKVVSHNPESNSDDEIQMIQETCLSDDRIFDNTEQGIVENTKSKENGLNSSGVDMGVGKNYCASDNLGIFETNKMVLFGAKSVASTQLSLVNEIVSEQFREFKENKYHANLQLYQGIGGEECDLIEGRKEINKSKFVEHSADVKASQKELENNPVLKTEHTYNAGKETNVKPNEVFIPDMNKSPLPIQYKFVRNGSKLVRVAVVQDTPDPDIVYDGIYDHQQTTNNNVEPTEDKQTYEQYTAVIADIDVDNSYAESVDDDSGFETGSGLCETARIDESCIQTGTGDIEKVQGDSCHFVTTETDIVEKTCNSLMEDRDNVNINKKYLIDSKTDIVKKTDSDFVEYFENTCFSESASTSSQISLCSNESPIVLKVDSDGKLSECTKCPASVGITAPILHEKKTEMDISYLSMKIQKIENDILEMKRVAEKSNEMKDCSQVKNKLGEKEANTSENEVNLSKTRMKDVDSQTEGIETKTVVNNVDKSMDADKIYGNLKETVIDYEKTNNEGNHGLLKKITEEAVTDTNTDNNEKARARKCIPLKEKAVDSHVSISDETKGKRKRKSQKKMTTNSSPNTCAGDNKRISRGCKSEREKAIDSTTNATDRTKSFEEKAADTSESTDNKRTMPHKYIPQKKKATGSSTNVDDDATTICLQQRSENLKTCGCCNTVNDNEMLNKTKDKPQKEIEESTFKKSFDKNGTNVAGRRSIKKRKQPTTSLNIPSKKKQRQTRSLFSLEHFKATERYDIVSPKSLSGKNLSDEESQDETDDYMIYNEEYLQKLYQHKLNEVRHIQNALKRMRQKSECSIEVQSETETMNKYCAAESETEENVDIESDAKVIKGKEISMGKKTCDTKRNRRKVIGSNMSNVNENLSSNMNTDSTSSMNLSTKSKNLSTKSKPLSRLKGKSKKSRVTKRVTWSEKSNRACDTSSAEPNQVIDSTTNLTVISMPAQHDWKNVPTNEKRVQENKKRSSKKSGIIHSEESAVSELNDDPHHEREHLVICKGNKTPNSLDDTGSTPDCVLKQNRKRKVETSCINTRKSVQVKRKSGQTAKEETSTSDAGKEGNEKDINRLNYQVNNPVTKFLTSDKSFSKSENIEQKRNRLESIISEKLKFKNTENVVDSQLKVDDQGQGLAKNVSYSCTKRKVSRKKVDKDIDTLITKNKPQPKVSARKSKLRGVSADNKNLSKKSKVSKDAGKQKSGSNQSTKSRKMAARSHPARLAFEKSCDYTWKEKLDSDAFFLNLQTKQGKAKRPLNVKKIIKKILVPKDSPGKQSNFNKRSKHLKRHKVENSEVTPSVKHTFSDSDDAVQSDTAYLSDNNVSVMSFPGMKLSKEHVSPEKLASGKEGNNDLAVGGENEEMPAQNNKDMPIIGDNKRTNINLRNEVGDTSKVSVRQSSVDHKKLEHLEKNIPLKSEKGVDLIAGQENKTICIEIHESPSETEEVEIEAYLIRGKSNNGETSQKKVNGIPQTSPTSPRYMKTFDQIRSLLDRKKNTCTGSAVQQQLSFLEES